MFCPQCGNASLDKVEVVVSEGGLEQFGVRKRHILRGTRFSLPKPAVRKNTFAVPMANSAMHRVECSLLFRRN